MIVTLPEGSKDITLDQFQRMHALNNREGLTPEKYEAEFINIFTGIPKTKVKSIKLSDYESLVNAITKALNTENPFTDRFIIDGVEYGFMPSLDEMTQNEFWHLSEYEKEVKDLHLLMAVLFRPITKKDKFNNYEIETFKSAKERGKVFKKMTMNNVNGALGFFLTLSKQLRKAIQRSTAQELARVAKRKTTSLSGDGMQLS